MNLFLQGLNYQAHSGLNPDKWGNYNCLIVKVYPVTNQFLLQVWSDVILRRVNVAGCGTDFNNAFYISVLMEVMASY